MGNPHFRHLKRCIFCDNKPDSREHAWQEWCLNRFPTGRIVGNIEGAAFNDPMMKAVKVKCVCIPCNTIWMKALEESVFSTAGRMMADEKVVVDILQQWTIAKWAVKTAMVWEHVTRERGIFYTDAERRALKNDGTIPPNTVVWLSRNTGDENFFSLANDASSLPGAYPKLHAYLTTLAYNRLVIQVMTVRPDENYRGPQVLLDCNQRVWKDTLLCIWPSVDSAVWPPLASIGPEMLRRFHRRCGSHQIDDDGTIKPIDPDGE